MTFWISYEHVIYVKCNLVSLFLATVVDEFCLKKRVGSSSSNWERSEEFSLARLLYTTFSIENFILLFIKKVDNTAVFPRSMVYPPFKTWLTLACYSKIFVKNFDPGRFYSWILSTFLLLQVILTLPMLLRWW